MTTDFPHTDDRENETENVLLITVREGGESVYEEGRAAIETLDRGEPVEQPDSVTFPNEALLARMFTEQTLGLLRVITDTEPASIRETARLVERDVKNVHKELTRFEAMVVIRFVEESRSKRPVFPYDELVIDIPFGDTETETPPAEISG